VEEGHPLAQLLRLVDELDHLTDEDEASLKNGVSAAFGEPLARAASRGRLRLAERMDAQLSPEASPALQPPQEATSDTQHSLSVQLSTSPHETSAIEDVSPITDSNPPVDGAVVAREGSASETVTGTNADAIPASTQRSTLREAAENLAALEDVSMTPQPVEGAGASNDIRDSPSNLVVEGGFDVGIGARVPEGQPHGASHVLETNLPATADGPLWRLIKAGRLGLAYQLCATREAIEGGVRGPVTAAILDSLLLGPFVRTSSGGVVDDLQQALGGVTAQLPAIKQGLGDTTLAGQLLVLSAVLRPAVFGASPHAATLLATVSLPGAGFHTIQTAIVRLAQTRDGLTPSLLKGMREIAAWEQDFRAHGERCRRWLDQNRQASIIYAPTTDVWRQWLQPTGPLGEALEIAATADPARSLHVLIGLETRLDSGPPPSLKRRSSAQIRLCEAVRRTCGRLRRERQQHSPRG
jgi:hypothetical protein